MRLAYLIALLLLPTEAHAMPAVIVAGAAAWAGGAIATSLGMGVIGSMIFKAAFSFVANSFAASLFGKESPAQQNTGGGGGFSSEAQGRTQVVRSAVEPRALVIGEVMKSGPLIYAETSGTSNEFLHMVIPIAPHQVFELGEIRFNDIVVGDLDAQGNVTTGQFAGFCRIKKRLGAPGQVADADLIAESAGKWTSAHVGVGVADIYIRLKWSQSVYPTGIPNVKVLCKGALMQDPRDSVTRYSNNWAIAVRHYLKLAAIEGGLESEADEVNDSDAIAAANICDERVTMAARTNTFAADAATDLLTLATTERIIATGDGVRGTSTGTLPAGLSLATTYYYIRKSDTTGQLATTAQNALEGIAVNIAGAGTGVHTVTHWDQARYTANGTIDTSKRPLDILRDLMTAAAGTITYPGGEFRIFAGAYTAPAASLSESDLRGPMTTRRGTDRKERFNGVRGTYSNPANFWQPSDFPLMQNAVYVTSDGEEIWRNIDLPYTTDAVRAQRIAKIHLEESRMDILTEYPAKMTGFNFAVWETVNLNIAKYGWAPLVMRVAGWKLGAGGIGVDLKLRKVLAANYSWNSGEASTITQAPDSNLPNPFNVSAPGTPSIVEEIYETTGSAGVKTRAIVSWAAAADAFVTAYEAQVKAAAATDWLSLAPISLTKAQADDLAPGSYNFRVRAINGLGVISAWSATATKEMFGLTAPPTNITAFSIIKSSGVGIAQFGLHPDLDVRIGGRIVVRWSPATSGATWAGSIVFEEFNGDAVSGIVPLRSGTYMAKARDSGGNYSVTEASYVATEGLITGFTTAGTITEHSAFTGVKTSVALVGSGIQLADTRLFDDFVDTSLFDAIPGLFDDYDLTAWYFDSAPGLFDDYPGVPSAGSYEFSTYLDLATVATRRFESNIAATQFIVSDVISARTTNISTWANITGTAINDCDATLYMRPTNDNPAGSPVWGAWTPFYVSDFSCRAAQFRLDLESGERTHNIAITSLSVTAKIPI